ncbi:MAG: gliding motility-associated C-terminal domain-containing protein [Bacteroidia bacterium]
MKLLRIGFVLAFLGLSGAMLFAQGFLNPEGLQAYYSVPERMAPLLQAPPDACEGEVVKVLCGNCHEDDALFWAVQGSGEIIRKTENFIEVSVTGEGAIRVALERENFWGIGRGSKSFNGLPKPTLSLPASTLICEGDTADLLVPEGLVSYRWNDGADSASRRIWQPGLYRLHVTSGNGCKADAISKVAYRPTPVINLGPDVFTCSNQKPVLTPGEFDKYRWNNGSREKSLTASYAGKYWVEVTDVCGQKGTDTLEVIERKIPPIELGDDQVLCTGDTLTLNAGDAYGSFQWSSGARGAKLPIWSGGTYSVSASDVSGCVQKASIRIEMSPCKGPLALPTKISPNRDGLNDVFQPLNKEAFTTLNMQVFSPSGLLLYMGEGRSAVWDATFNRAKVPAGNYPFTIQYRDAQGKQQYQSGNILIQ